ncbi:DNA primase [Spiroplasma endosymbiont of Panorpa germanica]|uniref:DNA primase n=1 Tax=Spiroplasma endosymbiont of Panorpa germanica TaxID=3066314 RepID=UPI0030D16F0D
MSGKISQELINKVIEEANIVEWISSYIKIQKKGQNYQTICPFHKDNNPSLVISPAKRFYKCFSCNESGNVINFVKNYENISFIEAFRKVASKTGVDIKFLKSYNSKPKYNTQELRLFEINSQACKFFTAVLNNKVGIEPKKYLNSRKITEKQISNWEIGFAFKNSGLKDHLVQCGFEIGEIIDSGLLRFIENDIKDVFVNRITFPIKNEDNYIIGFSGRIFNKNESPKYLNTSETKIFKKSELAFNFNNAKFEIKRSNEIIILEGFMDVISLAEAGIKNCVAIMGTSLSDYQIELFKKVTKNYVLFLDGDEPGVRAALKAANKLLDLDLGVKIIFNESQMDPDEMINKYGVKKIKQLIEKAQHPIDFVINYFSNKLDLNNQIELEKFISEIKSVFIHLKGDIFKSKTINKISNILNVDENIISRNFNFKNNYENKNPDFITEQVSRDCYDRKTFPDEMKTLKSYKYAEESLIIYLINSKDKMDYLEDNVNLVNGSNNKKLINMIIDMYRKNNLEVGQPNQIREKLGQGNAKLLDHFDKILDETNYVFLKNVLKNHSLEDSISLLETKKIEDNNKSYLKKMHATNDYSLKENYNKIIEKNYVEVIKLRKKREKK